MLEKFNLIEAKIAALEQAFAALKDTVEALSADINKPVEADQVPRSSATASE